MWQINLAMWKSGIAMRQNIPTGWMDEFAGWKNCPAMWNGHVAIRQTAQAIWKRRVAVWKNDFIIWILRARRAGLAPARCLLDTVSTDLADGQTEQQTKTKS